MFQPQSLLVVGDLHGDPQFTLKTFQYADDLCVDAIVQCGDFGFWEHMQGGDAFLDFCSELTQRTGIPLFWVDGNHENHTLLRAQYAPGKPKHVPAPDTVLPGAWQIRDGLFHLPRGLRWEWSGVRMMSLGGAYSVDKYWRLQQERKKYRDHTDANNHRRAAGASTRPFMPEAHQLWWPEEELTDAEIQAAIANPEEIDILFTHDKPRGSNPNWNRKDLPECWPNQDRIQTVVTALHPKLLIHGHLHYRYTDTIPSGNDGKYTRVEGLDCNTDARQDPNRSDDYAWLHLGLVHDVEAVDNLHEVEGNVGEAA